ncbi:hypothetical protein D3C81_1409800 [compost metagenome]
MGGQRGVLVHRLAPLLVNPLHGFAQGLVETQGFDALGAELRLAPVWPFDADLVVAEVTVIKHLCGNAIATGRAVEAGQVEVGLGDPFDMLWGKFTVFVAEIFAQFAIQQAGVDQLHLASALRRLVAGEQPDIGGDAGVVEQVVGQLDDGIE